MPRCVLVPGASSPKDPGGTIVINRLTPTQPAREWQRHLHLFKLPAIRHGGHHLCELFLLTLKHTVHMLHRHLQEQGPQVRRAPRCSRPSTATLLLKLLILGTAQQEAW